MSEKEYEDALGKIEAEYEQAKKDLYIRYGKSQAKYKVGDTIGNEHVTIKVDKVTIYKGCGLPEPVYHGTQLKKDLTPRKDGSRGSIYGNNATFHNAQ